PEDFAVYYCQQ
nr:immunoglobulin light chain junction region [Homo sapiens]MCB87546.1 immunoglobulin light chain junction region [Homo sapiens]MCC90974.1 immunoglobulin light chain junction region [Homo sapiens]